MPSDPLFSPLPPNLAEPSPLDANPRFLRLPNFTSRFLPTPRDLLVYLPEAYLNHPSQRFPVLYLHDGQNLFDGRTSYIPGHTWRAHLTADALTAAGLIPPLILIGIANAGVHRIAEYTPTPDPQRGGGLGPLYGRLLTEETKPLIDRTFRTLPDADNTALGGSSLGGLISLSLGLDHPSTFSRIAVLSPSVWWDHRIILDRVVALPAKPRLRLWLDMGTAEGPGNLRNTDLLYRRLLHCGWQVTGPHADLRYLRVPAALHNEDAWAARFDQVLRFLFSPHPP